MDRSRPSYDRANLRPRNTARLCSHGYRHQLGLGLLAGTQSSLAILVSPLEHLVRIYSMLTGHSRNRSPRNKRGLHNPTLLLPCPSQPPQGRCGFNYNRIVHKLIVGQVKPPVYTAKSGRLYLVSGCNLKRSIRPQRLPPDPNPTWFHPASINHGRQSHERVWRYSQWIECEFTLSSIRNELFVGTSLLQCQPPPHRLLQAWNKLGTPQGMACVRALTVHKISDLRSSLGGTSCAMVVVLICRIVAKKRG